MGPPSPVDPDPTRGAEVEAILWEVVTRLRARGWHISLWEIQRSQDVIAYLVARFRRAPTDDELRRHLRPVLCARDSELAPFDEIFQDAAPATQRLPDPAASGRRTRRVPVRAIGIVAGLVLVLALPLVTATTSEGTASGARIAVPSIGTLVIWAGAFGVIAGIGAGAARLARSKRLRRRPTAPSPGHDLELSWAASHPLETLECVRLAKALRARTTEPGRTLDVRQTVDASIRAGLRLTPRFVQHKRAPEFLAVIEQRTTHDVLAAHHARIVDQIGAHGVAIRRVGIQPRSQLFIHPVHGRRRLEALQPTCERERLLLLAPDTALRDPLTGVARSWLARFDRWSETIRIGPDDDLGQPLHGVDRVLTDLRCLDPAFARTRSDQQAAGRLVPALFDTDDELWTEPVAPPADGVTRALDLLLGALGPNGWYWLSACALYPEIRYELTVALGRLLSGDDGQPLAHHVGIERLARLPWFRHAYMPDWLRTTLISTMPHGQLVEARAALQQILLSGLLGAHASGGRLFVAEAGGAGRARAEAGGAGRPIGSPDRVYLDGVALRRSRLAAAAPKELVAAVRRQRHRFAVLARDADAPSPRVRRTLVWCNASLVVAAMVFTLAVAWAAVDAARTGDVAVFYADYYDRFYPGFSVLTFLTVIPAAVTLVYSWLLGRRRGATLGASALVFAAAAAAVTEWTIPADYSSTHTSDPVAMGLLLGARFLTTAVSVVALRPAAPGQPVPWAVFHRRNRRVLLASLGIGLLTIVFMLLVELISGPVTVDEEEPTSGVWFGVLFLAFFGYLGACATASAAVYFAGVPINPLVVAAVMIGPSLLGVGLISPVGPVLLLASAGGWWQLRRVAEHPPPESWEAPWWTWRWPLAAAVVVTTALVAWYASTGDVALTLAWVALPATVSVLILGAELLGDRFARLVQRNRFDLWLAVHLD
jgi:hypothetical protein